VISLPLPRRDDLGRLAALTLAYAMLAAGGLAWSVYQGAGTAVWPASGLAFAGLLLGGVRLWPAILIGRLLVALLLGSAPPLWADLLIAVGSALSTAAPVAGMMRSGFDRRLGSVRDVVILVVGALAGTAISATAGALALWLGGAGSATLPVAIQSWSVGYATGVIVVAPLLLAWRPRAEAEPQALVPMAISLALYVAFAVAVLFKLTPFVLRGWHLFPVLAALAVAFGLRGVTLALLLTSIVAIASAAAGVGPLAELFDALPARMLYAQQFVGVTAATLILLAAAIDESRAKDQVARARASKAAVLDVALDAIITMDESGRVVDWNDQAARMFGHGSI